MHIPFNKAIYTLLIILTLGHLPDFFITFNLTTLPGIKQLLSLYFLIDPIYAEHSRDVAFLSLFSAFLMFPLAIIMCYLYRKGSLYFVPVNLFYCGMVLCNILMWTFVLLNNNYTINYPIILSVAGLPWILSPVFFFFYHLRNLPSYFQNQSIT